MIVSTNPYPSLQEFEQLMKKTDFLLNEDADKRPNYYHSRGGSLLEDDITSALTEASKGTHFEKTIEKISGHKFPDIIASKYYGVEVKSTTEDKWKSTGNSILETTRGNGIERIYLTFGKLGGNPIRFISKPYERCLYDIAVTHMPRYLIDMQLPSGKTIFDKLGLPYDELRSLDNPIAPVAKYYRSQLHEGESLWWAGDATDESVSATIRLWNKLSKDEKLFYSIYGCVNFPEIFGGDYDRYALWLTSQGIVDSHIRDQFSAGGQEEMVLSTNKIVKLPGIYRRIKKGGLLIVRRFAQSDTTFFHALPTLKIHDINNRLFKWINEVSHFSPVNDELSIDALSTLFWGGITINDSPSWIDMI